MQHDDTAIPAQRSQIIMNDTVLSFLSAHRLGAPADACRNIESDEIFTCTCR